MTVDPAKLMNGAAVAEKMKVEIRTRIEKLVVDGSRRPCLATVLVGEDPGSRAYVSMKQKAAAVVGIDTRGVKMAEDTQQDELIRVLRELSTDATVDGILLQLPLPRHLDQFVVLESLAPSKDVDGLTCVSAGLLLNDHEEGFVTCTPAGIIRLLDEYNVELKGAHVVVINHSSVVGRPLGQLLLNRGATVTTCHVHTRDLGAMTRQADIVVTAVGRPGLLKGDMIKEGAVVVDAGYGRKDGKVHGDAMLEEVAQKARLITPPTGGVGPMTIAYLLHNTLHSYELTLKKATPHQH
eukprot:m51a1_g85 putative bifunctional -methylene-tetrahydrofolate dehydrogenase -methylene-tetrahydrofolate cyclohydrolase (295) ;mRNA; f:274418-275415